MMTPGKPRRVRGELRSPWLEVAYAAPDAVVCLHCRRRFRAIMPEHLRWIHGYRGDHPVLAYKVRFGLPNSRSRATQRLMRYSNEKRWERVGRRWTRKRVQEEIERRRARRQGLAWSDAPEDLRRAAVRRCGSWEKALRRAGVNPDAHRRRRLWTPADVIGEIRRLAASGHLLYSEHARKHWPTLYRAAVRRFPSAWGRALKAAGFDPAKHRMPKGRWSRESAAEWVQERARTGRSLWARDTLRDLCWFVIQRLRMGWPDFIESLDIPYPGQKKRRDWSPRVVLRVIRRLRAEGLSLQSSVVHQGYQTLWLRARTYFGSWADALHRAGVKSVPPTQ